MAREDVQGQGEGQGRGRVRREEGREQKRAEWVDNWQCATIGRYSKASGVFLLPVCVPVCVSLFVCVCVQVKQKR